MSKELFINIIAFSPFRLTFAQTTEDASQPHQLVSGLSKTTVKQTLEFACQSKAYEAQPNNSQSVNGDEAHYTNSA